MIVKSEVDTNTYRRILLDNDLEVVLVSNPILTKASFALSVKVGSFDEPAQFCGLAHFLEHMLFMGTENYPGVNDFMNFLNMHNGYTNAYTADEMTVYYCDIDASEQDRLADMFSSFFICPLFVRDAVNREISAVDSEYLNSLTKGPWRLNALLGELLREGETRGKFGCGNAETLRQKDIWKMVVGFWKEHYSSDLMKLVICSSADLGAMERMAMRFAGIKKVGSAKASGQGAEQYCRFDSRYYKKVIQMAPLDDRKELLVFVDLPPLLGHFKKNPLSFINFAFTRPESGGLLARLKTEGLAYTLSMEFEYFTFSTRVKIQAELTGLGCREYGRVLDLIVAHLGVLRADEKEFARLKRVQEEEFRIQQPDEPLDLVESLAAAMQQYPAENAINHSYVYESFDDALISSLIRQLSDYSRWIVVVSDNSGKFAHKEKYYSVEYAIVGEYEAGKLPAVASVDQLPDDKYLDGMELTRLGGRFVKTEAFSLGRVVYVFDQDFAVPRSDVFVRMKTNTFRDDFVGIQLYLSLIEDAFNERHARELWNYHVTVSISVSHDGALVHFQGVSSKMAEVCERFFKDFCSMRPERFALFKRQLEDFYTSRITKAPFERLWAALADSVAGLSSYEENLQKLRGIAEDAVGCPEWSEIDLVAVGNIRYEDACAIYESAVMRNSSKVTFRAGESDKPQLKSVPLKTAAAQDGCVAELSFKTHDVFNNGLGLFYRLADLEGREAELQAFVAMGRDDVTGRMGELSSLRNIAIGRLIHQISSEDFFNQLRTIEELGYCVCSTVQTVGKQQFLAFLVQSQQTVEFLERRILKFVDDMKVTIRNMDDETFSTYKNSLIGWYEEPLLNLYTLSRFVWSQTVSMAVDLEFNHKMAVIVESLKIEDLLSSNILDRYRKVYSVPALD